MDPLMLLQVLGKDSGSLHQMLALQGITKEGESGFDINKLILLQISEKFGDKLAKKIQSMDESKRSRMLSAVVSLLLASKADGDYKSLLDRAGMRNMMLLLNEEPEIIDTIGIEIKDSEGKILELGGEIRDKTKARNVAKEIEIEGTQKKESKKESKIRVI